MAARKSTTKKSAKTASRGKQAAQRAPEAVLSRAAWGAIWAVLGLLCLLAMLPIDGVVLVWLHRGIGAVIGKGSYVLPFALLALAGLLFARDKGPVPAARHLYCAAARADRQYCPCVHLRK